MIVLSALPCFSENTTQSVLEKPSTKSFFEDVNFSLGTGLSYLNGQYREIVYPDTSSVNEYLSELLWNLDNVFLLNFNAGVSKGPWELGLTISTALTSETGKMTDTDWTDSSSSVRTHWSLSKIWLDNSFLLNTDITRSFDLSKNVTIKTGLGYRLDFWDWEDEVLEYDYPYTVSSDNIGVNGIDYKVIQNIFYASTGVIFSKENISTAVNIALSPFIYAWDLDHHILTQTYYVDTFYAKFWYRAEMTLQLRTGANKKLIFTLFREELPETIGDTFVYDEDIFNSEETGDYAGTYTHGAGMASILWGIGLSYIWTF